MQERRTPTIVPFEKPDPCPGVVKTLEEALRRACNGEFVSVAVCAATTAGESVRMHHVQDQQIAVLASLVLMTQRLGQHLLDGSEDLGPVA